MKHRPRTRTRLYRRLGSVMGIVFLLVLVGIFLIARMMLNKNERNKRREVMVQLSDPRSTMERFFMERSLVKEMRDGRWKILLQCMSSDDQQWLEKHKRQIASKSMHLPGLATAAANDNELTFAALDVLLRFGPNAGRPIVSTVEQKGNYAVAYYHQPNEPATMQPAFLINEGGQWHIMRFLGTRDEPHIMLEIVEAKEWANESLSAEEERFKADPSGFPEVKRQELLAQVGLAPGSTPGAAATPVPPTISGAPQLRPDQMPSAAPTGPVADPTPLLPANP